MFNCFVSENICIDQQQKVLVWTPNAPLPPATSSKFQLSFMLSFKKKKGFGTPSPWNFQWPSLGVCGYFLESHSKFLHSGFCAMQCLLEWFPHDCYNCCNRSRHMKSSVNGCILLFIANEAILVCAGDLCVSVLSPQLLWFLVLPLPVVLQQWQLEALKPQVSVHGMQAP